MSTPVQSRPLRDHPATRAASTTSTPAPLRLAYYAGDEEAVLRGFEGNVAIDDVPRLLDRVEELGVPVQRVDTTGWSESQLAEVYSRAVTPAVVRHSKDYSVRRAFGTRRHGGAFFGLGVPALLVFEGLGDVPVDVYPHYERDRVVTIRDYLLRLVQTPGEARATEHRLTPQCVARLRQLRRDLFGDRVLAGDSVELIRAAREGR